MLKLTKVAAIAISLSMCMSMTLGTAKNKLDGKSEKTTNKENVSYYKTGPVDLSIANEEKIVEMLKREGKLNDNATLDESHKMFLEYMKEASKSNNIQITAEEKNITSKESKSANNSVKKIRGKQVKNVNVLAVVVEYSDYKHNEIQKSESDMYYDDYSTQHYQDMLFGQNGYKGPNGENLISMNQYYDEQSGGSLDVTGKVTKWYTVDKDAKYYGEQIPGANDAKPRNLVKDALTELGKDKSIDLNEFDKIDRYDLNGNGNYNEPDGVIDYLLLIHAGVGQEAGGGKLGSNAIWSHRSNLGKLYDIPGTNYKAFDYIMNPEDGATGVFAHEFGHDLGLPDEYDTIYSSDINSPVANWSLMASGSWAGKIPGTEPVGISAYSKELLQSIHGGNWQKQKVINYNDLTQEGIEVNLKQANESGQVVKVNLPDIYTEINKPTSGKYSYWSGKGSDGNTSRTDMTKEVDLNNLTSPILNFKAWYDIENGWDFAAIKVREKGTDKWKDIKGNITTTDKNPGVETDIVNGITGNSNGWVDATFDLKDYVGKNIELQISYETDIAVFGEGLYLDDINILDGKTEVFKDDSEEETTFKLNGFSKSNGQKISTNYYLIEWRNHSGVDKGLQHINYVDNLYSYDPGMVIWYVNNKYSENWTGVHPGGGFLSVIDADPVNSYWAYKDGRLAMYGNSRFQMHDAAFNKNKSSIFNIDLTNINGSRIFDNRPHSKESFIDYDYYENAELPQVGTKLQELGVEAKILYQAKDGSEATIKLRKN